MRNLWNDDCGIVTLEYLVLGTILALGLIVGVTGVTAAMNAELSEFASAILALNQSYESSGFANCVSSKGGSQADDTNGDIGLTFTNPAANNIDVSSCP